MCLDKADGSHIFGVCEFGLAPRRGRPHVPGGRASDRRCASGLSAGTGRAKGQTGSRLRAKGSPTSQPCSQVRNSPPVRNSVRAGIGFALLLSLLTGCVTQEDYAREAMASTAPFGQPVVEPITDQRLLAELASFFLFLNEEGLQRRLPGICATYEGREASQTYAGQHIGRLPISGESISLSVIHNGRSIARQTCETQFPLSASAMTFIPSNLSTDRLRRAVLEYRPPPPD